MTRADLSTGLEAVRRDRPVRDEILTLADGDVRLPHAAELGVAPATVAAVIRDPDIKRDPGEHAATEAVVLLYGRPVLFVRDGKLELPRSKELRARLLPAKGHLEARLPSIGRIEFTGHPGLPWGGTGWMIDDRVVVTNRHVAELFSSRGPRGYRANLNPVTGDRIGVRIDFREEDARKRKPPPGLEFAVTRVLFMEADGRKKPDIAFLALESAEDLPPPIPVLEQDLTPGADIAVVGYPSPDPEGVPSPAAAKRIFQDTYGVKRLAPGQLLVSDQQAFFFSHDATTLRGNSGSVVLDLETGAAAGLHFMGQLGEANFAVKATEVRDALSRARRRQPRAKVPPPVPRPRRPDLEELALVDVPTREGFDPTFLGPRRRVELPIKTTAKRDLLTFEIDGKRQSELRYTHFSVAMSVKRKLCLWSAVNIDGEKSQRGIGRPHGFYLDRRIPPESQTLPDEKDPDRDVYGNAPRFARGHITRREDPIWGDPATAKQANVDSMHYPNIAPQMQSFNGKIWNNLEEYALQNARDDSMRISVITGPVFTDRDPVRYGVKIPLEFWKIIAFVHDETGKLTATAYRLGQQSDLAHEEFVFGDFDGTHQVQIATVERLTGLSFGTLTRYDPKRGEEAIAQPLTSLDQIRFV